MVFSSLTFIFYFLPIFLFVYFLTPRRWKNSCLLAGSLLFYSFGVKDHPLYAALLLFSVFVNYRLGIRLGRRRKSGCRKGWLAAGIFYNLSWLVLFKYAGFISENINLLLAETGCSFRLSSPAFILPIGISFYTFQAISYLTDVYRKDICFEPSLINFGMYICMFPQLIAGPIVTYASVRKQISARRHSLLHLENGLREFTIGLGLKVLLANQIGGLWNDVKAIGYKSISTPLAWLGLTAFSMQIYFDFYGYSLMAKGLGEILGFKLPNNFEHPYMALSMTEFWRKWHITLGNWFRDYLYIPLGGNRKKPARTFFNLFSVWLLTGFWHGASWNFLLWGLLLFVLISVEKLALLRFLHRFPLAGHAYMALAIPLTWMVFALPELSDISVYVQRLFPFLARNTQLTYFNGDFLKYGRLYSGSLTAGLVFITALPRNIYNHYKKDVITAVILLLLFWACIYRIRAGADDPFLYFRF